MHELYLYSMSLNKKERPSLRKSLMLESDAVTQIKSFPEESNRIVDHERTNLPLRK